MNGFSARPPAMPIILLDDEVVRITRWDFEPGAATGHHVHGWAYVVVTMTDCHYLIEDKDGARRIDVKKGAAYRREAGIDHNVINGGDEFMSFIEIDYK